MQLLAFREVVLRGELRGQVSISSQNGVHDRAVVIDECLEVRREGITGRDIDPDLLLNNAILLLQALVSRSFCAA
ncbi:hypothetical protein D3C72_2364880 [compost metagenome]